MMLLSTFLRPYLDQPLERESEQKMRPLYFALLLLGVGMVAYSQTLSLFWDEGFHILTARLIDTGKRPYLDFFFPQTPLNAYWNAAWMAIFGPRWRVVHVVAALVTTTSVLLMTQYIAGLFPDRGSQLPAAFAGLALFGLHPWTWMTGTLAQAYPLCLLLVVAAFRAAVSGVARPRFGMSALAGLAAGAAAASSLLTALISPVLLVWMGIYNRAGSRWIKAAAFLGGALVAWIPVLVLFARSPHVVTFDILKYHTLFRQLDWPGVTAHDVGTVTDWINSSSSLLLVLLALAGLSFMKESGFSPARLAELRLCLWLALAVTAQNIFAHPTFSQYFVFTIPFLSVLGVVGLFVVAARLDNPHRRWTPVILLVSIMALCSANTFYDNRDSTTWHQLEQIANKVKQVTPKDGALLAPEQIYFLANWPIPPGMEHADAHKLKLPPAENARLHVLPKSELDERIKSGGFSTTVICGDDDFVSKVEDWQVYAQSEEIGECTVLWKQEKKESPPLPKP